MQVGPASILDMSKTFTPARGPVLEGFESFFLFKAILRASLRVEYNGMMIGEQKLLSFDGKYGYILVQFINSKGVKLVVREDFSTIIRKIRIFSGTILFAYSSCICLTIL